MFPFALAAALPPPPCNNAAQITDATGDGHHPGTDVLAAWWSEASGHLQAVIQVRAGVWVAEHDDAQINGSGFALIYNGTSYVRVRAPAQDHAQDPLVYDYGTYGGQFTSAGATAGAIDGNTVTVDVPGAAGGARLASPYVITYDGINAGVPTWVDHAPGGTDPADPSVGADYIVGACNAPAALTTTSVHLSAPTRVTGARTVTVSGKIAPARAGVPITLTRDAHADGTTTLTSAADGSFSARIPIGETTRLRAVAEGVGSNQLTVTAYTKVKVKVVKRKDGSAVVTGTVDPKLPGRVLWLRSNAVTPSARTTTRNGTFRLRLKHPRRGRYQAVVIPTGARAERATSNTGVIR